MPDGLNIVYDVDSRGRCPYCGNPPDCCAQLPYCVMGRRLERIEYLLHGVAGPPARNR